MKPKEKSIPAFFTGGGQMGELIRSFDWSKTSVGSLDTWPQSLRIAVRIMLDTPFGMYIAWGNEYIQLYNDGYRPILGATKHPQALGISTRKTFAEIWNTIGPMFEGVMQGTAVGFPDFTLQLDRNGFLEECVFDFSYSPIRLEDGEVGGVLVTVIETTEKVKAARALKESEQELQFAIEATELGTWDLNPATNKFRGNSRLKEWFGLKPDEEIELPLALAVIADRDRDKVTAAIQTTLQFSSGGHYDIVYTIIHPQTKNERIVRAKGRASFNDQGIAYRFNGTLQDVTKEIVARRLLTESEQRLGNERMVLYNSFMNAPAGITIVKGGTHIYEFVNAEYEKLVGRKITLGKTVQEHFPELEQQGMIAVLNSVFTTGEPFVSDELPVELNTKGDEILEKFYLNLVVQPLKDEEGKTERILAHIIDVTHQVNARKQIEASEKRLSNILSQSIMAIAILKSPEMIVAFANEPLIATWRKGNDIIGKPVLEVMPEMKDQGISDILQKVYKTGVPYYGYEEKIINIHNGIALELYYNLVYQPYTEADDTITGITVLATEVTEQVLAKKQVEESESRFRMLSENIPNLAWMAYADGNIFWYNQRWYDYTGTKLVDMEGWGWQSVHDPEDLPKVLTEWKTSIETGQPFEMVFPLKGADGKFRQFLTRVLPVLDSENKIYRWFGTNTDISKQIEAEQKIKESEAKFRALSETLPHLVWTATPDGKKNYFNKYFLDYTGLSFEKLKGDGWLAIVFPDDLEKELAQWHQNIKTGDVFVIEQRVRRHDGTYRWHLYHSIPQKNAEGKITGWIGSSTEIEEQKQFAEELEQKVNERTEQLQLQNQTFELAECIAKFGSYSWKITTGSLEYSDNLFRLLDCEPQEFVPSFEKFLSFIHPDDLRRVVNNGEQTMQTGALVETPYRIISKTGKIKHLRSSGSFTGDNDNRILIGTVQDISKDVLAAEELAEKEDYLNQIISNAPDAVIVINEKSIITLWNPKTEEIFGWKAEEVLGLHLTDTIIPTQYRENHKEGMKHLLETGKARILNKTLELTALNKAGNEFPISLTISQAAQQGSKLFIAFLRDITLEKHNKKELIVKTQQLEEMNQLLELKNKELENSNAELASFSYVASHDLQEPLRKIQAFSKRIIEVENFSDKTQDYFNRIIVAGERMQNLIVSLLDFSRTSATELIFEPCDLTAIVEESKDNLQLSIIEKQAVIESENLSTINASHIQLSQLFTNLIDNAIKYSRPEKNPHIKITTSIVEGKKIEHRSANNQKEYHKIKIEDNGIGFEKEYENKIFEPFQRLHGKNEYSGTGIGLAIVKKIVTNHDGFIVAEGMHGIGSTFTVYIPTT